MWSFCMPSFPTDVIFFRLVLTADSCIPHHHSPSLTWPIPTYPPTHLPSSSSLPPLFLPSLLLPLLLPLPFFSLIPLPPFFCLSLPLLPAFIAFILFLQAV